MAAITECVESFDATTAKTLAPDSVWTFEDYPGLRFQVSKKYFSWIYRYKSPTTGPMKQIDTDPIKKKKTALMKQIKIGMWPKMSFNRAVVEWERLRAERLNGTDPAQAAKEAITAKKREDAARKAKHDMETYTVGKLVQDYIKGHLMVCRQGESAHNMKVMLEGIPAEFSKKAVVDITRADAHALIFSRKDAPVRAACLRRELAAAWNHAMDAGLIPESTPNFWPRIMKGKLRSKGRQINGVHIGTQKRVLSEAEVATLLAWLPNFHSQDISDFLTIYLWTATRGGESTAMHAREIHLENGQWWWQIPKARTKNARIDGATDLRVPLIGRAQEIVLRRLAQYPKGYLFPSSRTKGGHFGQDSIGDAVNFHQPYSTKLRKRPRERLTVTYWAPHDLRRTARTMLASLGCVKEIAEAIIGHVQPGVEGVYNLYSYDKERVEWLGRLAEKWEAVVAAHASAVPSVQSAGCVGTDLHRPGTPHANDAGAIAA